MNCLLQCKFPSVISVALTFNSKEEQDDDEHEGIDDVLQLIRHFGRESPHFSHLSLMQRARFSMGRERGYQVPHHLAQMMHEISLHSLTMKECSLSMETLDCILSHPSLKDLQVDRRVPDTERMLSKPSLLSRADIWWYVTPEVLQCLTQFTRLEDLSISLYAPPFFRVDGVIDHLPFVAEYLPKFQALSVLTLTLPDRNLSEEEEALLLSSLNNCHSLRRVDLLREFSSSGESSEKGMTSAFIEQLLISKGCALDFLSVNMRKPLIDSYEHVILKILKVVHAYSSRLKGLHLILGLIIGETWRDLVEQLRNDVEVTEKEVEGLKIVIGTINSAYKTCYFMY